jgi:hypothetical protein
MSILGLALGAVGITGIGAALVLIPGAMAAATRVATAAVSFIAGLPWAKIWWIVPLAAALVFGFIERGNARHWQKVDAGHVALIGQVKAEVDRGVGMPTRADQSPIWIRRFVDNVNVLDAALRRQTAAALLSHADAENARGEAHTAAQATQTQDRREKDRQSIIKGSGALTPTDWGKL